MPPVIGIILTGGQSRRMDGQDKALLKLNGKALWEYTYDRISPIADILIVSGLQKPEWIGQIPKAQFIQDALVDGIQIGPMGGLAAVLRHARLNYPKDTVAVSAPIDAPFFPTELPHRLVQSLRMGRSAAIAQTKQRLQPIFSALKVSALEKIEECIDERNFALHSLIERIDADYVSFEENEETSFININSPADLIEAEILISKLMEK